jgi:hypothetical protein
LTRQAARFSAGGFFHEGRGSPSIADAKHQGKVSAEAANCVGETEVAF